MYQFPFLLITDDEVRNSDLSDMITDEMFREATIKKSLFDEISSDIAKTATSADSMSEGAVAQEEFNVKHLYDILELKNINTAILIELLRCRVSVLQNQMPEMDIWRVKDKLKRILTLVRRKSPDLLNGLENSYNNYDFGDTIRKTDLWEEQLEKKRSPMAWNNVLLNRLSDIHKYIHFYTEIIEPRLLTRKLDTEEKQSLLILGRITEGLRYVHKEVKDYVRFVNAL